MISDDAIYQFSHASVIYREAFSKATNKVMPSLFVMSIDQYHFQREFSIRYTYEPGNSKDLFWLVSIYQHPGRQNTYRVSTGVAKRLIGRFLQLCREYPDLLFNHENERYARHDGFVRFAEMLHRGAAPSVKLLG